MSMTNEQIQALKAAAEKAKELGCIAMYSKAIKAKEAFKEAATPDVILSLLAEREADKALIAELNRSLDAANERYENRTPTEWAYEQACAAIEKHRARADNAELKARTLTIEPFRSFVTDADLAALHRFSEFCDDPEADGHDLEKEQVRRLEAIGALQRCGRISYITGFGDTLISITAGITLVVGGEDATNA